MRHWLPLAVAVPWIASAALAQEAGKPLRLSLKDAIDRALGHSLGVQVAETQVEEASGTRLRRLASQLPRVSGDALWNRQTRNLAAFGITIPGQPSVVGPFSYFDFRASAEVPLVDRQAFHQWKASERNEAAARLSYQDARDLAIRQVASLYLDSQASWAEIQSAESRIKTSEALAKLAADQRGQGLATGVDVLRARVQLSRDKLNLVTTRNTYQTSLLSLARFLGLSPASPIELVDELHFRPVSLPDPEKEVAAALAARPDYASLLAQREGLRQQQRASQARYLPRLSASGDYGAIGQGFSSLPSTWEVQGTLSVSLFDKDRSGERAEIDSRATRLDRQIEDLARGIEADLRKAILDLQSTEDQVAVSEETLDLAKRELTLAEDRFRNGVTDNIEVITAQSSLASSEDEHIAALVRHADAAMALARALGATEKNYETYLGETR